jgi:hypothetical protein
MNVQHVKGQERFLDALVRRVTVMGRLQFPKKRRVHHAAVQDSSDANAIGYLSQL